MSRCHGKDRVAARAMPCFCANQRSGCGANQLEGRQVGCEDGTGIGTTNKVPSTTRSRMRSSSECAQFTLLCDLAMMSPRVTHER